VRCELIRFGVGRRLVKLPLPLWKQWGRPDHVTLRVGERYSLIILPGARPEEGAVRRVRALWSPVFLLPRIVNEAWPPSVREAEVTPSGDGAVAEPVLNGEALPDEVPVSVTRVYVKRRRGRPHFYVVLPRRLVELLDPRATWARFTVRGDGAAVATLLREDPGGRWLAGRVAEGREFSRWALRLLLLSVPAYVAVLWPADTVAALTCLTRDAKIAIYPLSRRAVDELAGEASRAPVPEPGPSPASHYIQY
jgi:hypothetical protein